MAYGGLQTSAVQGKCPPRSGGIAASSRHAEEADDFDDEEEDDLFFFLLPITLLLATFLFLLRLLDLELFESDVTRAAVPFPQRASS